MRSRISRRVRGWSLSRWLAAASIGVLAATAVGGGVAFSLWLQAGVPPGARTPPPTPPSEGGGPAEIAGTVLPPPRGSAYWGAYRLGIPDDRRVLPHLTQLAGSTPAIAMYFQVWEGRPLFDVEGARWLASQDIVPMLSWEPWTPQYGETARLTQPEYRLARIAGGHFDGFIERYAQKVNEYGGPLFLRPFHEMDGDWYPWAGTVNGNTPEDFVEAWRHVHDLFERAGATNVTWVWSVNHVSTAAQDDVHRYWPGDEYVDWIGISGFNWGSSRTEDLPPGIPDPVQSELVSSWTDFDTVYGPRYGELARYQKPIVLTEMSSVETGGDKAAWIHDAVTTLLEDFPEIRAFVWYDRVLGPRDWRIDSTLASLVAFRSVVDRPEILPAPYAAATTTEPDGG
jgi:mannan endo-1,4-beta-mannosidase